MRLGGRIFLESDDPAALAREHRRLGYSAAYCPDTASLSNTALLKQIESAYAAERVVIAEVGEWRNMLDPDAEMQKTPDFVFHETTLSIGTTVHASKPLSEWGRVAAILGARRETFTPEDETDAANSGIPARRLVGLAGAELTLFWRRLDLEVIPSARLEAMDASPASPLEACGPSRSPRRHLAVPHGAHAADEEGADHHQREHTDLSLEQTNQPLITCEQPRYSCRAHRVHGEQTARDVPRRAQRAGERHVNPMVVVGR